MEIVLEFVPDLSGISSYVSQRIIVKMFLYKLALQNLRIKPSCVIETGGFFSDICNFENSSLLVSLCKC